jgi:hypothetical protein
MANSRQDLTAKLQRFAKANKLKVNEAGYGDSGTGTLKSWEQAEIGDQAVISDPVDHPMEIEMYRGSTALRRALRESGVKNPLTLYLSSEQTALLYDRIGFDVRSYFVEQNDAEDLNSSTWGVVLHRVGFRYWGGDDTGVSLLFSATDLAQTALALALAKIV